MIVSLSDFAEKIRPLLREQQKKLVAVSGGFAPPHVGHVRLFREARRLGDQLVILVNGDEFLRRKTGHIFMPLPERLELLDAFEAADFVIGWEPADPADTSVAAALAKIKPDIFANGGDRAPDQDKIPLAEEEVCREIGCEMLWGIGGADKPQSSSWLIAAAREAVGK